MGSGVVGARRVEGLERCGTVGQGGGVGRGPSSVVRALVNARSALRGAP